MFDMSQLMRAMQGGLSAEPFRSLGLGREDAERAMAAMLPAFMMSFARRSATPDGGEALRALMDMWMPRAGAPAPRDDGRAALTALFGSDAMTQEVARQASLMTGIGIDMLRAAMPGLAEMFVSGAARLQAASLDAMRMPKAQLPAAQAPKASNASDMADPMRAFGDMMGFMNQAMNQMASAMAPETARPAKPEPEPPRPGAAAGQPDDLAASGMRAMTQAMDDGRRAQADYLKNMEKLFDSFYGKPPA